MDAARTPDRSPIALPGTRVAVTGAGGFIGLAVARALAGAGADVVGIDLDPGAGERLAQAGARFVAADITDGAAMTTALDGCAGVVHTAARVTDWGPMAEFVRVNVGGTRTVLDAARAVGARQVVHVSSVATFGYECDHDLPESAPERVCGAPYVDTKSASQALALHRGAAVVRPGDVYGPGSIPWVVRPLEALRERRFFLPGRGDGVMTPVYIDDLVSCILAALTTPAAAGVAVTAWDGVPVSAAAFFAHHARMLGMERCPTLPAPLVRAGAIAEEVRARLTGTPPVISRQAIIYVTRRAAFPNTRAQELLGWRPQVSLDEGMRRTREWAAAEGLLG